MLELLPVIPEPRWLSDLLTSTMLEEPFPLHEILRDSLYYPSCSFDGDPVKYLGGNILSFIYVDYGYSRETQEYALSHPGFRGYDLLTTRSVSERELTPNGWNPTPLTPADGDPARSRDRARPPYCLWSVFQRRVGIPPTHGPSRFSLLYLGADGVAAFQALYMANNEAPKAVAIIQPGYGFGGNWTDFTDPDLIFAKSVLRNPAGQPDILLYGSYDLHNCYLKPCWPQYGDHVCFLDKEVHGRIGVWRKSMTLGKLD